MSFKNCIYNNRFDQVRFLCLTGTSCYCQYSANEYSFIFLSEYFYVFSIP